ncbi:transglycosylase SLT domain-containing protein [Herminiimonas contaminans]|uniref:Transglycosylase SLT domain-containing protein n=1 Tax=Herminiimonas contaminans TaxID=1111140 RepID=A0ABS0ESI7_9BURK|nr:transglycosylase SLT domain-containing protein [Herminiimonas contaminans]MBF8177804.1 transglycosylase SLT domain-containing protein [Herminiimonas contaminans]
MRVPTYTSQVDAIAAPVVQQTAAPAAAFGGQIADAVGRSVDIYKAAQDDADNLRVQDAYNQLREKQLDLTLSPESGFANVKGRDVMKPRDNGMSMSDDYLQRFGTVGSEIESGLVNERQKAKFRQRLIDSQLEFKAGLQRHENQQISEYGKTVTNATVTLESEAAFQNWQNPDLVNKSIATVTDSLRAQGMREGLPADAITAAVQDKVSKIHSGVLALSIQEGNLRYAEDYLKKNSASMEANDILKYKGAITKEIKTNDALLTAEKIIGENVPKMAPTDFDRLVGLVAGQESGNRERDSKGNLITSPKGAQGKMQVMPGTNLDPGYGVTPAKDGSDAERTRVGKDYLKAMLKEYGGDLNKALAAYNAGPGALDAAIKKADKSVALNKNDPAVPVRSWMDFMPKETQKYVPAIASQYSAGTGVPKVTLVELQNQTRAAMAGKDPAYIKLAVDAVTQRYDATRKSEKDAADDLVGQAYKLLDQNGGNYNGLPADMRAALPGDKIDNLQAYANTRAKGQAVATDWGVYYDLRRDDDLLKSVNLYALKGKLGDAEFKQLVTEQENIRTGKSESTTATRSATQILNSYLTQAGIDPTPKPSTSADSDAARVGRAMRAQQDAISQAESVKGGKLTAAEVEKVTAGIFTNVTIKGTWFGTNSTPKFNVKSTDTIVVPDADRAQIVAALTATKRPVTEAMILDMYRRKNNLQVN